MVLRFDCDSSLMTDVEFSSFVIFLYSTSLNFGVSYFGWEYSSSAGILFFVYNVGFMGYDFHRTFFMSSLCCIIHGIIFLVLGYSDMNIGSRYGKTKGLLA